MLFWCEATKVLLVFGVMFRLSLPPDVVRFTYMSCMCHGQAHVSGNLVLASAHPETTFSGDSACPGKMNVSEKFQNTRDA